MAANERSAELGTGVTLRYAEYGQESGVPLLLLPGLGDSWHSYEPVMDHLPDSIHAVALTQRSHGDSTHPPEGYRLVHFVKDLEAFLDALQIDAAVLAGHSSHGVVSARFAIDHPHRTMGLVLIGTPMTLKGNKRATEFFDSTISNLVDPLDLDFVRGFSESTLSQPLPDLFLETIWRETMKVPARVFKEFFKDLVDTDFSSELHKIRAPALLVWGDRDVILSRRDQDMLTNALPNSRLVVYPGAGHSPHWEEPEHFAGDVASFIETLGNSQSRDT